MKRSVTCGAYTDYAPEDRSKIGRYTAEMVLLGLLGTLRCLKQLGEGSSPSEVIIL